jgi:hypothetical protein
VVTLGAEGWNLVDAVHHERPSFLDGLTRS